MSKEAFTTNVKFLALKSGWALMVTVNKQHFQYLNILYYWTNSRQTKPDPNISKKGVTEVAQN